VLAVEPAGDDGGDEELGAVAARECVSGWLWKAVLRAGCAYVLGPALAMDRSPGLVCFFWKFSSANFSP
jgi:hypothetical protein